MLPTPNMEAEKERRIAQFTFIMDIAAKYRISHSALLDRAKRMGLKVTMLARAGSGKAASALSPDDARALIATIPLKAADVEIIDPADLMGGDKA